MLDKILSIIPDADENLISLYIDIAQEEATAFCAMGEYSNELDNIVIMMVIEKYNKRGNEGIASTSFSGVSESYIDGYSAAIKQALLSKRKLVLV